MRRPRTSVPGSIQDSTLSSRAGPAACGAGKPSPVPVLPSCYKGCPKVLPFEAAGAVGTQKLQAQVPFTQEEAELFRRNTPVFLQKSGTFK